MKRAFYILAMNAGILVGSAAILASCVQKQNMGAGNTAAARIGVKNASEYRAFLARYTGMPIVSGGQIYDVNFGSINGSLSTVSIKAMKEIATQFCDVAFSQEAGGNAKLFAGINLQIRNRANNSDAQIRQLATNLLLRANGRAPASDEVDALLQMIVSTFETNPGDIREAAILGCTAAASSYSAVTYN